ncbi:polysaccharide biosynthesis/export family protein [Qipengyuania flava]|uniref:polysaccharide biosynthesis/export family protein n=1 Tax=Qipengyuania flava TaxID=192812 RepID=UPI001C63030A|nr:polysaccharide biosynthesis/export family protein [Qipengyuania flava]QYJ06870.1 polysaccharide biosynthesis/export family protein [Qipengyuania flava]
MPTSTTRSLIGFTALASLLGGCVAGPAPANHRAALYAPQQFAADKGGHPEGEWEGMPVSTRVVESCRSQVPGDIAGLRRASRAEFATVNAPLAPGDRLSINVLGDVDRLTGTYVVESDGTVRLRGIAPSRAGGLPIEVVEAALRSRLVESGMVKPLRNAVSISLVESAGVSVAVAGAVFDPNAVRAGERTQESRIGLKEGAVTGDANVSRSVATAIRAAGGVRPDADIERIYLVRGDAFVELDLSGLVRGFAADDIAITTGDRIIVPSRSCFAADLVRPTPLTTPGIRVYMSNLTRSANNNAGAAIGKETTSLPYGTRLLQALVAANCVGGSYMQSDRRAVLISRNPMNGRSVVIERDIEKLVREADRDTYDPFLMPGDAIACYDSRWTNLSEAIGVVSQGLTPAILVNGAL